MNRIAASFARTRARSARAVIPFVCGGFPSPGAVAAVLPALSRAGATIIEVGVPFSDPIADGPVIAAAMHQALNPPPGVAASTLAGVLAEIAQAREQTEAAIVAMVSCSIVFKVGEERFIREAAAAGLDGVIFPDLLLEESGRLRELAAAAGLTVTLLIARTTPPDRARRIAAACTGFVYLIARTGITGDAPASASGTSSAAPAGPATSRGPSPDLAARVAAIRSVTQLPIACGFGISTPADVRAVLADADAAIVGSSLVRRMGAAAQSNTDPVAAAASYVTSLLND